MGTLRFFVATLVVVASAEVLQAEITFLNAWGGFGAGDGQFYYPMDVSVGPTGSVFVADNSNNRVQKFDHVGNFTLKWGTEGTGTGQMKFPAHLTTNAAGQVYVTEYFGNRVQKFDSNGLSLGMWGSQGSGDGQFDDPIGIEVNAAGQVFVADNANYRIQKFDPEGLFLGKWGTLGTGIDQFGSVIGLAVAPNGTVYVADASNQRIQKFDSSGLALGLHGTAQFQQPYGIASNAKGEIYVTSRNLNHVQKLDSSGAVVAEWGSTGSGDGQFANPHGLTVSPTGEVYVADYGNNRIQRFFDSDAWVSGTNQFGNAGVGTGQLLGNWLRLTDVKTLIVDGTTTVESGGTLELLGGSILTGSYIQRDGATLRMGIGGTSVGAYDRLAASGSLSLNGTLHVDLRDGFEPGIGNSFNLFDASSTGGQFDFVELPNLGSGLTWDTSKLYTDGTVSVTPEPGTLSLCALIAFVLSMTRERTSRRGSRRA